VPGYSLATSLLWFIHTGIEVKLEVELFDLTRRPTWMGLYRQTQVRKCKLGRRTLIAQTTLLRFVVDLLYDES